MRIVRDRIGSHAYEIILVGRYVRQSETRTDTFVD